MLLEFWDGVREVLGSEPLPPPVAWVLVMVMAKGGPVLGVVVVVMTVVGSELPLPLPADEVVGAVVGGEEECEADGVPEGPRDDEDGPPPEDEDGGGGGGALEVGATLPEPEPLPPLPLGVPLVPGMGNVPFAPYTRPLKLQAASPDTVLVCQHSAPVFTPTGGAPTRLSLQLPGCPAPLVQRTMMLVPRELPAQYAPLGSAHTYLPSTLCCVEGQQSVRLRVKKCDAGGKGKQTY